MGISFEDLRKDSTIAEVIDGLEKQYGKPLPVNMQKLLLDLSTSSEYKVQQNVAWIKRTVFICDKILDHTAHESEYPLFWIHLYAVVIEFFEDEAQNRDINLQISFKRPIMQALDAMHNSLTENDIVVITFMRHSHCHMRLHYIWHTAKNKEGKIIVKPPHDPEAREVSNKILSQYKNQNELTLSFAKRLITNLKELEDAVIKAASI